MLSALPPGDFRLPHCGRVRTNREQERSQRFFQETQGRVVKIPMRSHAAQRRGKEAVQPFKSVDKRGLHFDRSWAG